MHRIALVLCATLLLPTACGGPRQDHVPHGYAQRWDEVLTVEVLETWDLVKRHVDAAPQVTHLIEVEVLEGPSKYQGRTLVLPFDAWAVGQREAPPVGTVHTIMPSQWVRPNRESRGRPAPRWRR